MENQMVNRTYGREKYQKPGLSFADLLTNVDKIISRDLYTLRCLDLDSTTKILLMVLYKHQNQMRREKSVQYLRKVAKLIARIKLREVVDLLSDSSKLNHRKYDTVFPPEMMHQIAKHLVSSAKTVLMALRLSMTAASHVLSNLQLGTFVSFNVFAFACVSRIRVQLDRLSGILMRICTVALQVLSEDARCNETEEWLKNELSILKVSSASCGATREVEKSTQKSESELLDQANDDMVVDVGEIVSDQAGDKELEELRKSRNNESPKQLGVGEKSENISELDGNNDMLFDVGEIVSDQSGDKELEELRKSRNTESARQLGVGEKSENISALNSNNDMLFDVGEIVSDQAGDKELEELRKSRNNESARQLGVGEKSENISALNSNNDIIVDIREDTDTRKVEDSLQLEVKEKGNDIDVEEIVPDQRTDKEMEKITESRNDLLLKTDFKLRSEETVPVFRNKINKNSQKKFFRFRKKHALSCVCWICQFEDLHFKNLRNRLLFSSKRRIKNRRNLHSSKKKTFI